MFLKLAPEFTKSHPLLITIKIREGFVQNRKAQHMIIVMRGIQYPSSGINYKEEKWQLNRPKPYKIIHQFLSSFMSLQTFPKDYCYPKLKSQKIQLLNISNHVDWLKITRDKNLTYFGKNMPMAIHYLLSHDLLGICKANQITKYTHTKV